MAQPIPEHQAAPKTDDTMVSGAGYTPTEDERKVIKKVRKLFEKSKKAREKYDRKWQDYYRMFRGRQWKEERPSYRHSAVLNKIFQTIQSQAPLLTDSRPKIEYLPQEPNDREFAEIMTQVAEADWESNNWLMELVAVIFDSHIYGTGPATMPYDPDYKYGAGGICFESASPFYCFPDPDAKNVNDKRSRYFIYAEPYEIDRLKGEYPEHAKHIVADLSNFLDSAQVDIHNRFSYKSPVDNKTVVEGNEIYNDVEKNKALKITCYLKDDTVVEEETTKTDESGQEIKEYVKKKKYPLGRKIVIQNNLLLEDKPMEYEDGKFPFARLVNYLLPREFWGESEIAQLEGPQVLYNKVFSFVLDVLTLMGNPIWIVDQNAGIDTDNIYNKPGMVLEPLPGSRVQRVEGTQLQPYVMQLLQVIGKEIQDISGATEVSRGVRPEGVTAAKAIEALQDTAQTRIRQKSRFLDAFLQEIGQMYFSRAMQFYTAPRVFRLTGNDNVSKYFKFHIETTDDGQKIARYREYVEDPMSGQMAYGDEKVMPISGELDVRVSTGSSLPFAKTEKNAMTFNLFDRGLIDAEEALKNVDYPNWQAVVERMKQKQEEAAMAQMGAGPAPEGQPQEQALQ